jgi:hypothetical protein
LNDILQVGPMVQPDSYLIALRFRTYQVYFIAYIRCIVNLLYIYRQWHQLPRCSKPTSRSLQNASFLIREDNSTPLQWPTGVILATQPGSDGNVHVVTIRTPKGVFKRPITKICPLPRVRDYYYSNLLGVAICSRKNKFWLFFSINATHHLWPM